MSSIVCIIAVVASLVVVFHNWVPASFAGLALAYSNQLTGMLQYTVRLVTEAESRFLSVQRIHSCIIVLYIYNVVCVTIDLLFFSFYRTASLKLLL